MMKRIEKSVGLTSL